MLIKSIKANRDHAENPMMLLKPWRNLGTDLKEDDQTWEDAFSQFMDHTSQRNQDIVSNIQYYHECRTASDDEHRDFNRSDGQPDVMSDTDDDEDEDLSQTDMVSASHTMDETDNTAMLSLASLAEQAHGRLAIEIAEEARIFAVERTT